MTNTEPNSNLFNSSTEPGFNFAYLDEQTKRSIRRAILKAVAMVVVELLEEKKQRGCALIGIFHDEEVRNNLCTRELVFRGN